MKINSQTVKVIHHVKVTPGNFSLAVRSRKLWILRLKSKIFISFFFFLKKETITFIFFAGTLGLLVSDNLTTNVGSAICFCGQKNSYIRRQRCYKLLITERICAQLNHASKIPWQERKKANFILQSAFHQSTLVMEQKCVFLTAVFPDQVQKNKLWVSCHVIILESDTHTLWNTLLAHLVEPVRTGMWCHIHWDSITSFFPSHILHQASSCPNTPTQINGTMSPSLAFAFQ